MDEYLVPTGFGEDEFIEKKSRFIGRIWRTETEEDAVACIKMMREQHWDARHNVYAYIIRDGAMRYSDDGEPQGTAGMPVLDVLRRSELYNVCCVVTRYFGGILLGTGGLVRAYAKSAAMAVEEAGISVMRVWDVVDIPCPYGLFERVKQELAAAEGQAVRTDYGAQVDIRAIVPQANTAAFALRLTDLSAGKLICTVAGQEYRAAPVKK